jgi:cell division initiation protein
MSRLTALEIKKKEFEQKMRGADTEAVQAFLDQVSSEVETLTLEKRELEEALLKTREKLEHYTSLESTIEKTLGAAQQTAVTMQEQAKKDAELILREADIEKTRKMNDARMEHEKLERDLMSLRTEYDMTLARMRSQLASFSSFVSSLERKNESVPPVATGGTLESLPEIETPAL